MPAPEVAVAYVSIVPEVQGFAAELRRQIVGPAQGAGSQAGQAAGSSFRDKLKAGLAGAAVAAGALLVKGLGDAIDQANITSKLQAQLGATGKDAGRYGKIAGKLYSSGVAETFQGAADAIKSVMQAGIAPPGATNAQLQAIATKASDVANTFDQDLGGVTNAVSQMMRTGLAKNSTEAFDIITKGFQSGTDKAGDLLDSINEYGTQFRKAGLDGRTAIGLMNQAIQAGARDSDIAADAIKEFSIRAVDGSKTTTTGFQALGLSATDMAAKFARGGKSASGALDLTLDRLRNMKDPVKQSAAATALFGTQAEDLGKALFAMDPSKAAAGLGKFGGAANNLGKTIRSGPSYQLQVFTRTVQQKFVNFLGKYVVPALTKIGSALNTYLRPALSALGTVFASVASGAVNAFKWVREYGPWFAPLAVAIAGVTLALTAQRIAMAVTTGVFAVYRAAILIGTAVTNGFAAAQGLLNAVMSLNPIALVVIAIAALVAAVIVAYNKVGWFRALVQAAWQGIQAAVSFAWNNVLKPVFTALGNVILWLWNNVVSPAFSGIVAVIKFSMIPIQVVLSILWFAIKAIGQIAMWLWNNAIKPAFGWIADKAIWLWTYGIKPQFNAIKTIFGALITAAKWLWNNGIKPVFQWVADKAKWLWLYSIKPAFEGIKRIFSGLISAAKWLWTNGIKPVFTWISDKAKWIWRYGLKPAFDAIKKGVKAVGDSFENAKNFISKAWGALQEIGKKPVRFLINTVYNGGIVPLWNKIATAFGAPSLKRLNIKGFATGGILPGYTPGRDVHLAALSGGEAIMRPEWTRAMGPGYVNSMNAAARSGGVGAIRRMTNNGMPAFKDGGIFGWIGSAANTVKGWGSTAWDKVKDGAAWLGDTIAGSAKAGVKAVVNPLMNLIPGLDTGWGQSIKHIPEKIVNSIFSFSEKADGKGAAALSKYTGGGKLGDWIAKAMKFAAVPASWAGPLRTLIMRESGGNPNAINRWDSNAKAGHPSQGLMQTIPGTFAAYRDKRLPNHITDPIANIVAGINYIKSRYGSISNVQQAVGSTPKGYDNGGWLMPGANQTVYNKTGRPEAVFTADQWSSIHELAARGASGGIADGARVTFVTQGGQFEAIIDSRADSRIHHGLVAPASLGRTL